MMRYIIILISVFLSILACKNEKADLDTVDSLIALGEYHQAGHLLYKFEMKSYADTMQVKRINARIDILARKRMFLPVDRLIYEEKWFEARKSLDSVKNLIENIAEIDKDFYLFDYYYRSSIIDSAQSDDENYIESMEKAVEYSTKEHENLWQLYEKMAFFYAGKEKYVKARENLDKALRKTDLNKITPDLQKIFSLYMNGEFVESVIRLTALPDSIKDHHWKKTQLFLQKYGKKLTMEDRFRLW